MHLALLCPRLENTRCVATLCSDAGLPEVCFNKDCSIIPPSFASAEFFYHHTTRLHLWGRQPRNPNVLTADLFFNSGVPRVTPSVINKHSQPSSFPPTALCRPVCPPQLKNVQVSPCPGSAPLATSHWAPWCCTCGSPSDTGWAPSARPPYWGEILHSPWWQTGGRVCSVSSCDGEQLQNSTRVSSPPQLAGDIKPLVRLHRGATEGQQLIPTVNSRAA